MNKSALIEQIAKRSELPISQSRKALDAILETITHPDPCFQDPIVHRWR